MALFQQVSIIGVGLIGGSLAQAMKKNRLARKVVGFFRTSTKLRRATKAKLVDQGFCEVKESLANSDLIILAQPVEYIIQLLPLIKKYAEPNAIIIDVGSTKAAIVHAADKLGINFIGCHPLAGSEKKGFAYSSCDLFINSLVILTPTKKTDRGSLRKIDAFWKKLKANRKILTPELHDKILALTSHLPHVAAYSLINSIPQKFLGLSATGLKDTTRIALSDGELWTEILLTNKKEILQALIDFERNLAFVKHCIRNNKKTQLRSFFVKAQQLRKQLA